MYTRFWRYVLAQNLHNVGEGTSLTLRNNSYIHWPSFLQTGHIKWELTPMLSSGTVMRPTLQLEKSRLWVSMISLGSRIRIQTELPVGAKPHPPRGLNCLPDSQGESSCPPTWCLRSHNGENTGKPGITAHERLTQDFAHMASLVRG